MKDGQRRENGPDADLTNTNLLRRLAMAEVDSTKTMAAAREPTAAEVVATFVVAAIRRRRARRRARRARRTGAPPENR